MFAKVSSSLAPREAFSIFVTTVLQIFKSNIIVLFKYFYKYGRVCRLRNKRICRLLPLTVMCLCCRRPRTHRYLLYSPYTKQCRQLNKNITKTRPCNNIQRFFSAINTENFIRKNLIFLILVLKTQIVGTR